MKHSERRGGKEPVWDRFESIGFLPEGFPQAQLQMLECLGGDPPAISICL